MDDKEKDRFFELGRLRLDELAKELRKRAGEHYSIDKHHEASFFLSLAHEFEERHKAERASYDKKYPRD